MQDKRLGGLDLETLWAAAGSARENAQKDAQGAVARSKVKISKPSKLKAAMDRAELATKEANRKLPRSERDSGSFPRYGNSSLEQLNIELKSLGTKV